MPKIFSYNAIIYYTYNVCIYIYIYIYTYIYIYIRYFIGNILTYLKVTLIRIFCKRRSITVISSKYYYDTYIDYYISNPLP